MTVASMTEWTRMSHKISHVYVHLWVRHEIEPLDLQWFGFPGFTLSCYYLNLQEFFQSSRDRVVERILFSAVCENRTASAAVITLMLFPVYVRFLILCGESWTKLWWRFEDVQVLWKSSKEPQELWNKLFESLLKSEFSSSKKCSLCT